MKAPESVNTLSEDSTNVTDRSSSRIVTENDTVTRGEHPSNTGQKILTFQHSLLLQNEERDTTHPSDLCFTDISFDCDHALSNNVTSFGGLMDAPQSKRRQVKNACTNCQKACKKCDDARPCQRCVKYGLRDECIDSQRKERRRGVKRGPYKKRDGKGNNNEWEPDRSVPFTYDAPPIPEPSYHTDGENHTYPSQAVFYDMDNFQQGQVASSSYKSPYTPAIPQFHIPNQSFDYATGETATDMDRQIEEYGNHDI
ncbi:hypothetical protein BD410DRAFT_782266 [Rickenella mellea]|uniref:Transcription activator of gluconeogenesis ERT1 n=1 Tax=Rickenella mellea TaxID=50990 RepID=A0A4Y7QJB0_9AGAM|nr:hypothetical protein BD410DRAFT_782266 [Rickenella mellea]